MKIFFFALWILYSGYSCSSCPESHETLLQGSGLCKCAAHFPPCMITIHGVCISLHKHAPCIVSRVGSGHARLLTAWVLCAFQGEALLATFCFWFAFSTIHGSRWQKSVIPDYVTAQTAPSIFGAISHWRGSTGPLFGFVVRAKPQDAI